MFCARFKLKLSAWWSVNNLRPPAAASHVEGLRPGRGAPPLSDVHVDVGGDQVVHLVALCLEKEEPEVRRRRRHPGEGWGNCHRTDACYTWSRRSTYQRRLAQEFVPLDQVPDGHVEVGAAAAPVSDAVERVNSQLLLNETKQTIH